MCNCNNDGCQLPTIKLCGIENDFMNPVSFDFLDAHGQPIDITANDFAIDLRQFDGSLIKRYTIGDGLTIEAPNFLIWTFGNNLNLSPGNYDFGVKQFTAALPQTLFAGNLIVSHETVANA